MTASEKCAKCGADLDTSGSPQWCKACRAKYQRDYQALRKEMTESRGYAAGVSAMREHLANLLAHGGNALISAHDTAQWIRRQTGPIG